MTVHKLTAGDGYTYLTRQVAAHDATSRGFGDLGSYYSERGEAPGVWLGRGCAAVPEFPVGEHVTEAQMRALFGEGRHPNADAMESAARQRGGGPVEVDASSRLGRPFAVHDAANMFRRRSAGAFRDHNLGLGLPVDTPVPAGVRAQIRTVVATRMFVETYGRQPTDARELSGHLARISRQATTAVAGYDLTFSPVKSVSALWAIAPRQIAAVIEQAQADAVSDTLRWLEDHAAYTRLGRNGVAQVEVAGLIAAAFTHRDSRAGDPDLHTHVAISNKVATLDGRWYALDGRPIYQSNVAASERYNTRLEALLVDQLGVRFAVRPGEDPAKRPVREIVGIDGPLTHAWSSRRVAIDDRRAELSATFQTDHGRPPTPAEALSLAQQANLETRTGKHEPRSYAAQREAWRAEAIGVLGGEARLHYLVRDALAGGRHRNPAGAATPPSGRVTRRWVEEAAAAVLVTVSGERATWQAHHVRAEAERHARTAGVRYADVDRAVDRVVAEALSPAHSILLDERDPVTAAGGEPAGLCRSDGASVFTVAGAARYTTPEIVAAEAQIVAAGGRFDGRRVEPGVVDLALLEATANGMALNPGQVQLVRELAGSGARLQLALAPAGTGKTTAMRVLSMAWRSAGGTVVGLAPSAAAAAVLREEIGADTDTLAKLTWHLGGGAGVRPGWMDAVGPGSLVVIDEAGMAGTPDLATTIEFVVARGGSVRLVGDDQQLAAIGAGGVLRDLAHVHGAVTLSAVMRFTHPPGHRAAGTPNHAEGAASLALRDGDPAAIGYYLDHGRVHVGDLTTVTDQAYRGWSADRAAGADPIMLAPTRELVAALNARARADRLAAAPEEMGLPAGCEVALAGGSRASTGDTIITRHNDRRLRLGPTDWVKNGDRWHITAVHGDGAVDVAHLASDRRVTLPAGYVARHVQLGYAATVHAAQGITADSCHVVASGAESRQLLYVAMTRGAHANHLYLTVAGDGDPHSVISRDALLPPTAGDILARVLARDDSPTSATSQTRALGAADVLLAAAAARYSHALAVAADDHLGPDRIAHLDAAAEMTIAGITGAGAYPALRDRLARLDLEGHDPATVLAGAAHGASATGGLGEASDPAAILLSRLDSSTRRSDRGEAGPLPWLPAVPADLAADPDWGSYLADRAALVTRLRDAVTGQARSWTPTSAPAWATPLVDRDPALVADLAVWRAAQAVAGTDRRPTGPAQPQIGDARAQRDLDARVTRLLGDQHSTTSRWAALAASVDPRITADPYWPILAARLSAVDRAGINITALAELVAADGPLPDEQPAAALWWRLAGRLSPAAITATNQSGSETLRPAWTAALDGIVGERATDRVLADPAWPSLVAAVTHAEGSGWEPETVLSMAYDLLAGGQPDDEPLRPDELATALGWRIRLLSDQTAGTQSQSPDPDSEPAEEPDSDPDLHLDPLVADEHERPDPAGRIAGAAAAGDRARDWAPMSGAASVPRARIVELNALAEQFYASQYPGSWAVDYLAERTGSDLAGDARFPVGYAPGGWTTLTAHLRSAGATDAEIVDAGLGARTRKGTVIDRFRDRLIFPIKAADPQRPELLETRGFIARRNPNMSDDGRAGPKYLNTGDTALFVKGRELYGLADHAAALAAGATPVLVEGPLDAVAVTLAGDGRYVGVAPLGTAFTDAQADALRPYLSTRAGEPEPGRAPIIVATDNDRAGRAAAHRAFWQLAVRREDPRQLVLAPGTDPADLLHTQGPQALRAALEQAVPLSDRIIADRTAALADRLDTIEGRVAATRRAADVLGALPPNRWPDGASDIVERFGVAPQTAINEVLEAGHAWTEDPHGLARQRLSERVPEPAPTPAAPGVDPADRWAGLVTDLAGPDATGDPHWPVLAAHLSRAQAAGYNVESRLRVLVALRPLPDSHALRDLDLRLVGDCADCLPPPDPAVVRDNIAQHEQAAGGRMAIADQNAAREQALTPRAPAVRGPRRDPAPARIPVPPPDPTPPVPAPGAPTRRL